MSVGPVIRSVTLAVLSVALLLGVAVDAVAKPGHGEEPVAVLTISGPELDGPILLNGERAWRVLYLSTFRGIALAGAEPPSFERSGPAFDARYRFIQTNDEVQTLRQTLYPCAADGRTWTFTPSGQDDVRQGIRVSYLVRSGWWHSVMLARVIGLETLEDACDRASERSVTAPSSPSSWTGLWAGLAAVAVLATIGVLARRSLRRRQPIGA